MGNAAEHPYFKGDQASLPRIYPITLPTTKTLALPQDRIHHETTNVSCYMGAVAVNLC